MQIQSEALLAAACAQTGLADFGGDSFREGLQVLCESASNEAQLNGLGVMAASGMILGSLVNRLKVTDWVRRHPEVLREKIAAPLVVVGMFRAGTTFLTYLMEKDPRHRPLLRWEAGDSVPPPTPATRATDPRIEAARMAMAMLDQINPRVRTVQSEEPDGPTECIAVLSQDFKSLLWEALANVPSYAKWLQATDHASAYAWHHRVLQVLQSGGVRGRWSLKSP
ncbi:MAG TPA: sulfotransferase, partial [Steroidobacteraceae bacterium]